jgi:hypothetical protein
MKKLSLILFSILLTLFSYSQVLIDRVEPPNWWVGMKNSSLQLMIHGKNIGKTDPAVDCKGVKIKKYRKAGPDYLFVDLQLKKDLKPCTLRFEFKDEYKTIATYDYELKGRENGSAQRTSFTTADNLYLIMPDRFANGDPSNDNMPGMKEKADRSNPNGRHGGDIKGIYDHLGYIRDNGFTAIWCTPLLENNMPAYSYHGYAITDLYKIDPRFGTNDSYRELIAEAHRKALRSLWIWSSTIWNRPLVDGGFATEGLGQSMARIHPFQLQGRCQYRSACF